MSRFVIYEVWTTSRVVEAEDQESALEAHEPEDRNGMSLCNWHAVPVPDVSEDRQ